MHDLVRSRSWPRLIVLPLAAQVEIPTDYPRPPPPDERPRAPARNDLVKLSSVPAPGEQQRPSAFAATSRSSSRRSRGSTTNAAERDAALTASPGAAAAAVDGDAAEEDSYEDDLEEEEEVLDEEADGGEEADTMFIESGHNRQARSGGDAPVLVALGDRLSAPLPVMDAPKVRGAASIPLSTSHAHRASSRAAQLSRDARQLGCPDRCKPPAHKRGLTSARARCSQTATCRWLRAR